MDSRTYELAPIMGGRQDGCLAAPLGNRVLGIIAPAEAAVRARILEMEVVAWSYIEQRQATPRAPNSLTQGHTCRQYQEHAQHDNGGLETDSHPLREEAGGEP